MKMMKIFQDIKLKAFPKAMKKRVFIDTFKP